MGCGERAKYTDVQLGARLRLLSKVVTEQSPALIALQESPSEGDLAVALGSNYGVARTIDGVATAHDNRRWSCDEQDLSDGRVAVVGLQPVGASESLWVLNVHGPALYVSDLEKQQFVRCRIGKKLLELRGRDGLRQNIVAGDLNLPPFDQSVVRGDGLHANRSLPWVRGKPYGLDRRMFNATWGILSCHDGACGTFYRTPVEVDGPWHAIDQIIMTERLVDESKYSVEVLEAVGGVSLRTSGRVGMPNVKIGSDHLPLMTTASVG
jgi:hypothetical protein